MKKNDWGENTRGHMETQTYQRKFSIYSTDAPGGEEGAKLQASNDVFKRDVINPKCIQQNL